MKNSSDDNTREQLIADVKTLVADAEALLKATANQGGEKLAEVRARAEESLRDAKASVERTQGVLLARTKAAARATDEYVHENPWQVVGAAVGAGLLAGLLTCFLASRR